MKLVFIGLTLSSSWGNGHATTYRSLLRGLHQRGHDVLFLEQDAPYYAAHRDLAAPGYARLELYKDFDDLRDRFAGALIEADAVIIGSYVLSGDRVIDWAADRARGLLCFYDIDTPVTLAALRKGGARYLREDQVSAFDLYLSFTAGPTLDELEQGFHARRAAALYCSVDPEHYRPAALETVWSLGYLGTYSDDRQPGLDELLLAPARAAPDERFVVAGSQYPDGLDWPENVQRIDHLPPQGHAEFYNRQRFTLNLTRRNMKERGWSPSVRLFEAAACGTAIISDRWEGLDFLFPENEAVLIADEERDIARFLEIDDASRSAIGACAREIVLQRHTGERRALDLEQRLDDAAPARRRTMEALS